MLRTWIAGLRASPRGRKLAAAAALGLGVWVVGAQLEPVAPREVEVRVRLAAYRAPPARARAVSVDFARGAEAVRGLSARFGREVPVEWRQNVSLPAGDYQATVAVELDGRSMVGTYPVRVRAGEPVELPAPSH